MIVCVAGPMAAGKNLASSILEERGFVSVDADELGHEAVEICREKILAAFGNLAAEKNLNLLDGDGKINRRNLGALVFASPELIQKQESIVYPEIENLFRKFLETNKGKNIVLNATVLYKIPAMMKLVDLVLFVDAPVIVRYFRARKRDGMKPSQIADRFRRQKNLFVKYKESHADILRVWNTGSRRGLEKKLDKLAQRGRLGINVWIKKEHCGY